MKTLLCSKYSNHSIALVICDGCGMKLKFKKDESGIFHVVTIQTKSGQEASGIDAAHGNCSFPNCEPSALTLYKKNQVRYWFKCRHWGSWARPLLEAEASILLWSEDEWGDYGRYIHQRLLRSCRVSGGAWPKKSRVDDNPANSWVRDCTLDHCNELA